MTTNMWTAKLNTPDEGHVCDVECDADTLLEAAKILTEQLQGDQFLNDLSCRGGTRSETARSSY